MSRSIEESYTLRKVKNFKFYFFCRVENHIYLISRCNITKGVKLPRSIRRMRSLFLSFPFFCWFHKLWKVLYLHILCHSDWKLWSLKMPSWALISSLTSLPPAVECWGYPPVNCCSYGSRHTHTSLQPPFNTLDLFLMRLYRNETKIPFSQERACWILNLMPHSQVDSSLVSFRPNLMQIRSQNNCLGKTKPSPERGTDVNQLEAPCSLFNSLRRLCLSLKVDRNFYNSSLWCCI